MTSFRKREDCPASEAILAYQTGGKGLAPSVEFCRHLDECEFCSAELDFYRHFPQAEEADDVQPIPEPLYELAEALLRRRTARSAFERLMSSRK